MNEFENRLASLLEDTVGDSQGNPDLAAVFEAVDTSDAEQNNSSVIDLAEAERPDSPATRSSFVLVAAVLLLFGGGLAFAGLSNSNSPNATETATGMPGDRDLSPNERYELDSLIEFHNTRLGLIRVLVDPIDKIGDLGKHTDAVVGTVVEVYPSPDFPESSERNSQSGEVDPDDPEANDPPQIFVLVVEVEETIIINPDEPKLTGSIQEGRVLIGVSVPSIELANAYMHLGRSVFFVHEASEFTGNIDTLGLGHQGTWVAPLDGERIVDFPLASGWPDYRAVLAAEPSLADLRGVAEIKDDESRALQWDDAMGPVQDLFSTYNETQKGVPDWSYKSMTVEVPLVEPSADDRSSFESLSVEGVINVNVVDVSFTAADLAKMRPKVHQILNAELDKLDEDERWEGSTGVRTVIELSTGLEVSHGFDRKTAIVDLEAFEARILEEVERAFPDSIIPISFSVEPLAFLHLSPKDAPELLEEGPAE